MRRNQIVKKLLSLCTAAALALTVCAVPASAAGGSLDNFQRTEVYENQFADVAPSAWYAENVTAVYELGLMKGDSATKFNPNGNLTYAETITMAARLHKIYHTGSGEFEKTSPWYKSYADYAIENGILGGSVEMSEYWYNQPCPRANFAAFLGSALPDEALEPINTVEDNAIPDAPRGTFYGKNLYRLYRAGVLVGNDSKGTFTPNAKIQRSAVAAIIARMADPSLRLNVTLTLEKEVPLTVVNELLTNFNAALKADSTSSSLVGQSLNYYELYQVYGGSYLTQAMKKAKEAQTNAQNAKAYIDKCIPLCGTYADLQQTKVELQYLSSAYSSVAQTDLGSTPSSYLTGMDQIVQKHLDMDSSIDVITKQLSKF